MDGYLTALEFQNAMIDIVQQREHETGAVSELTRAGRGCERWFQVELMTALTQPPYNLTPGDSVGGRGVQIVMEAKTDLLGWLGRTDLRVRCAQDRRLFRNTELKHVRRGRGRKLASSSSRSDLVRLFYQVHVVPCVLDGWLVILATGFRDAAQVHEWLDEAVEPFSLWVVPVQGRDGSVSAFLALTRVAENRRELPLS